MKKLFFIIYLLYSIGYCQDKNTLTLQEIESVNKLFKNQTVESNYFISEWQKTDGNAIIKSKQIKNTNITINNAKGTVVLNNIEFLGGDVYLSSKKEINITESTLNATLNGTITIKTSNDLETVVYFLEQKIQPNESETKSIAYPNPSENFLNIQLSEKFSNENINIAVYDQTGSLIFSENNFENKQILNTEYLNKGIYYLKIINTMTNYYETIKFIRK